MKFRLIERLARVNLYDLVLRFPTFADSYGIGSVVSPMRNIGSFSISSLSDSLYLKLSHLEASNSCRFVRNIDWPGPMPLWMTMRH